MEEQEQEEEQQQQQDGDGDGGGVVVVMVPFPAQGHLNQLLHLTRVISTRGIPVHYIGSATHNRQAKDRVHGWDPSTISNIHFHDFQVAEFVTPPPDPNASTKFPKHLLPTWEAAIQLREPLGELVRSLSSTYKRVVVVHDSLMAFAAEEASLVSNAQAYSLVSCSAFAALHFLWEPSLAAADAQEGSFIPEDVPRVFFEDCFTEEFLVFFARNMEWMKSCSGNLYNTCDTIEGRFIESVAKSKLAKKIWAVGPFNPIAVDSTASRHQCIEWLDKQSPNSVIYVSFGTMTSVSDDQIAELAIGLERSQQKFIWVLRDADIGDIYKGDHVRQAQLPDGFEERVKGVGIIVRDWAPQLQILAHPSTGGFMSHCGWNSCMESLSMGVPIAAWPMHSDQPKNALLVSQILKVGLMVREWSHRRQLISSESIESSITKLMASDEGNTMRNRARELGINVRRAVSDGGTSATPLDSFLAHISR